MSTFGGLLGGVKRRESTSWPLRRIISRKAGGGGYHSSITIYTLECGHTLAVEKQHDSRKRGNTVRAGAKNLRCSECAAKEKL